jgi:hypothetical protein
MLGRCAGAAEDDGDRSEIGSQSPFLPNWMKQKTSIAR